MYKDLLKKAGAALTTYAGALRTAQDKAADAIAKWQEGERATEAAVTKHNAAVDAYNAYLDRRVPVPSVGGPVSPSAAPARPGPFVDPGDALREEAQQILDDARKALENAGATAVKELGGLPGAKTESYWVVRRGQRRGPEHRLAGLRADLRSQPRRHPAGPQPEKQPVLDQLRQGRGQRQGVGRRGVLAGSTWATSRSRPTVR